MARCLILGDIHIGNNKNNPIFHDITLKYGDWVLDKIKDRNIDEIWQLGDIFHDRVSINIPSIQCAYNLMDKFKNYPVKIIVGNHDCFHLHNSNVHSLSLLKNWKNITVYDTPTKEGNIFFCPWGTNIEEIESSDIIVGHFEISSFYMQKDKVCTNGIKATSLMDKSNCLVLSGHFHKPQARKYNDKILLYTGSTFQLSWGESGDDKFIYILDTETFKIEKIKNDISPRFEYISSEHDFTKIPNNFISTQIENNQTGEAFLSKIISLNPLNIRSKIHERDVSSSTDKLQDFKLIDVDEMIPEFVNNLENIDESQKTEAINILQSWYKELS